MSLIHDALKKAGQSDLGAPRPGGRVVGAAGGEPFRLFRPGRSIIFAGVALLAIAAIWSGYSMVVKPHIKKGSVVTDVHETDQEAVVFTDPVSNAQTSVEIDPVPGLNAKGMEAFARGDFKTAVMHFRQSLVQNPDQRVIRNNLGLALKKAGDQESAEREYRTLVEKNAADHRVFNNLGVLLEETGRPKEAIDSYYNALQMKDNYADAHLNLALLLEHQGKRVEAFVHYQRFLDHARADQSALIKEITRHMNEMGGP